MLFLQRVSLIKSLPSMVMFSFPRITFVFLGLMFICGCQCARRALRQLLPRGLEPGKRKAWYVPQYDGGHLRCHPRRHRGYEAPDPCRYEQIKTNKNPPNGHTFGGFLCIAPENARLVIRLVRSLLPAFSCLLQDVCR